MSWLEAIVGGGVGGAAASGVAEWIRHVRDQRAAQRDRQRISNERVLRQLLDDGTEPAIEFMRDHDFGTIWHAQIVDGLDRYRARARRPGATLAGDAELDELRLKFVDALDRWYGTRGVHSTLDDGLMVPHHSEYRDLVDDPRQELWAEGQAVLNERSAAVVDAYDSFISLARKRLPDAFGHPPAEDPPKSFAH